MEKYLTDEQRMNIALAIHSFEKAMLEQGFSLERIDKSIYESLNEYNIEFKFKKINVKN